MRKALFSTAFLSVMLAATAASAQKLENVYKDWNVFTMKQGGGKVCYIASAPTDKKGTYKKRGEPYMLVTSRARDVDEVSISAGYPYAPKSEVEVLVDGKSVTKMFTKDDLAWAYTAKDDAAIVGQMKKGSKLIAKGKSQASSTSEDTYSLNGFSAAYKRMKELCK